MRKQKNAFFFLVGCPWIAYSNTVFFTMSTEFIKNVSFYLTLMRFKLSFYLVSFSQYQRKEISKTPDAQACKVNFLVLV